MLLRRYSGGTHAKPQREMRGARIYFEMCSDLVSDELPVVHLARRRCARGARGSLRFPFPAPTVLTDHKWPPDRWPIIDRLPSHPIPPGIFFVSLVPVMSSSNITVLTRSHAVTAKKRKAKRDEMREIVFDDEARRCVIQSCPSSCLYGADAQLRTPRWINFLGNF